MDEYLSENKYEFIFFKFFFREINLKRYVKKILFGNGEQEKKLILITVMKMIRATKYK